MRDTIHRGRRAVNVKVNLGVLSTLNNTRPFEFLKRIIDENIVNNVTDMVFVDPEFWGLYSKKPDFSTWFEVPLASIDWRRQHDMFQTVTPEMQEKIKAGIQLSEDEVQQLHEKARNTDVKTNYLSIGDKVYKPVRKPRLSIGELMQGMSEYGIEGYVNKSSDVNGYEESFRISNGSILRFFAEVESIKFLRYLTSLQNVTARLHVYNDIIFWMAAGTKSDRTMLHILETLSTKEIHVIYTLKTQQQLEVTIDVNAVSRMADYTFMTLIDAFEWFFNRPLAKVQLKDLWGKLYKKAETDNKLATKLKGVTYLLQSNNLINEDGDWVDK